MIAIKRHPVHHCNESSTNTIMFDQYCIAFGLISIIFGFLGFLRAKSKASLIAGGISGVLLILAGLMMLQGARWGLYLGFGVCVLLLLRFLPTFLKTKRIYPAGIMGALALVGTVLGALRLM